MATHSLAAFVMLLIKPPEIQDAYAG